MQLGTAGRWPMRWRGCLCLGAARSCLPGCGINSPRRVGWSNDCATPPAPTPLVVGAASDTMPAESLTRWFRLP